MKRELTKSSDDVTLGRHRRGLFADRLVIALRCLFCDAKILQIYTKMDRLFQFQIRWCLPCLPLMFDNLGLLGQIFAVVFFLLLTIAALTSSISMLECPVALVANVLITKRTTSWVLGALIACSV